MCTQLVADTFKKPVVILENFNMFTKLGSPNLFLTLTCNDFAKDFQQLLPNQQPWDDPVLFSLHFKRKFQQLLNRALPIWLVESKTGAIPSNYRIEVFRTQPTTIIPLEPSQSNSSNPLPIVFRYTCEYIVGHYDLYEVNGPCAYPPISGTYNKIGLNITERTASLQQAFAIHVCFKSDLLSWVIDNDHTKWSTFKQDLRNKVSGNQDSATTTAEIMNIKRKNFSSLLKYYQKFQEVKLKIQAFRNQKRKAKAEKAGKPFTAVGDEIKEEENEFFVEVFVKHLSPVDLRRYVMDKDPNTIDEAFKIATRFEDTYKTQDEDSDSEGYASDSSEDGDRKKRSKSKNKKKSSINKEVALPKDFKSALTAASEKTMKFGPSQGKTNKSCYNCNGVGHLERDCKTACKFCRVRFTLGLVAPRNLLASHNNKTLKVIVCFRLRMICVTLW
ncbi:unnamed protein product [Mucor hiemalis]